MQHACIPSLGFLASIILLVPPSPAQDHGPVLRLQPGMDTIVSRDAEIEKVTGGFRFLEGPVWIPGLGQLVFSDIPDNRIYQWEPDSGRVSVLLEPSGFTGTDPSGVGREVNEGEEVFYNLGSNGITLDPEGRLVFTAMGDRQIVRLEPDGSRTVLASHYQGKRLNSTNDLVYSSDGGLYFTDPPSALRGSDNDPEKEMDFNGVFRLKEGELRLLTRDIFHPNGLAFSPDEKYFYVDDNRTRKVYRFEIREDGGLEDQRVFVDMTGDPSIGNPDGMKVDVEGNVYVVGAGGIWVVTPEGTHLGKIIFPERVSNMTFGGPDAKTLYVTARTGLYRIRLKVAGIRP